MWQNILNKIWGFMSKMLSGNSDVSIKRSIALTIIAVLLVTFMICVVKDKDVSSTIVEMFNSMLIFVSVLLGLATGENIVKIVKDDNTNNNNNNNNNEQNGL